MLNFCLYMFYWLYQAPPTPKAKPHPSLLTYCTPLMRFFMCEHTVCKQASCFLLANQMSTRTELLFSFVISQLKCLKDFFRVPLFPFTVTTLLLALMETCRGKDCVYTLSIPVVTVRLPPVGTVTVLEANIVFIVSYTS